MKWHYSKDGQSVGPVESKEIEDLLVSGKLTQANYVWNETMGQDWKPISEVPAFGEMYGSPGEEREAGKLKFKRREESPEQKQREDAAMNEAIASITPLGLPKEPRRGPFTPSCPECGRAMKRYVSPEKKKRNNFGLVGILFRYAFASYACDRCGTASFGEMKGIDKTRVLCGTLILFVMAVALFLFACWAFAQMDETY